MNIAHFVALWNSGEFYAAHEIMEAAWLAGGRRRGDAAHALTLLAVAAEHLRRGNRAGGRSVLRKALVYLDSLPGTPGNGAAPELSELRRRNLGAVIDNLRARLEGQDAAPVLFHDPGPDGGPTRDASG